MIARRIRCTIQISREADQWPEPADPGAKEYGLSNSVLQTHAFEAKQEGLGPSAARESGE